MPSTTSYSPTGDANLDGVLMGVKWATTNLTFSFPTASTDYGSAYGAGSEPYNNFKAFTSVQQTAVRQVLQAYQSVSKLVFTETAGGTGDFRYAESDSPSTAWGYYPSSSEKGGDMFFNNTTHWYDNPLLGNYAYLTVLHETGHALGLKHPQDAQGSFGVMPANVDSLEYTVMSYKSYIGSTASGYTNGSGSYPQSLMMYDIAAVQQLYGANYATNAGDTVYRWSNTTGQMSINGLAQTAPTQNKIFLTVWDGGGKDTYDLSNYTNSLKVDLRPGAWSTFSTNQLADLNAAYAPGTKLAAGNVANALLFQGNAASLIEAVIGGSAADRFTGNDGDNWFTGGAGNDWMDGLGGNNTAIFTGLASEHSWIQNTDGSWTVTDLRSGTPDGVDTLVNIQLLQFSDQIVTVGTVVQPPPPANTAPVANADSYKVTAGQVLNVNGAGVLANDTDANGDALTAHLLSGPSHGTLTLNANGSLSYTPTAGYTGSDSFIYAAYDGQTESNPATVTINVAAAVVKGGGKGGPKKGADFVGAGQDADHSAASDLAAMHQDQAPAPVSAAFGPAHAPGWEPVVRPLGLAALLHHPDVFG